MFVPENKLEESLIKAANEPSHRPQFYKDFYESEVYIIGEGESTEPGSFTAKEKSSIKIHNIEIEGKLYIPIFSSLTRLQTIIDKEVNYLFLGIKDLLELTKGADLILNPGSDYGKEFLKDEIAQLLDGSIWKINNTITIESETQVMLGQPKKYPKKIINELIKLFKTINNINKAYLAHIYAPDRNEPSHNIIGIETFDDSDWDSIVAKSGMVVNSICEKNEFIDIIKIENSNSSISKYMINDTKPFYVKDKKKFS